MVPVKIKPTWGNKKVGEASMEKRLDKFLIVEGMRDDICRIKQWVNYGEDSYHFLIVLEMAKSGSKPTSPFKFNPNKLHEEDYIKLVLYMW